MLAAFGIFVAPFGEELFFRGFLYPAVAYRAGVGTAVAVTSVLFALIHSSQLGHNWAPLLVILAVSVVFTMVRAITKSVATSTLIHMSYNATLFVMSFIASQGFHRLR